MKTVKQMLLAIFMILAFIISCGKTSEGGAGGKETTLTLMIWDAAQKDGVQSAVDAFTKENPNLKEKLR